MSISEKNKPINKKIELIQAQYNLHRQAVKVSALSSGNAWKYEVTTQYNKLSEDLKKRVNVPDKPEILILDFEENCLPPMPALGRRNYC